VAHVLHHAAHDAVGLPVQAARAVAFLGERAGGPQRPWRAGHFLEPCVERLLRLLAGGGVGDIQPARSVDVDLAYAHRQNPRHGRRVLHGEPVAHEVVLDPVAVQIVDEHAGLELFGADEFDHGGRWQRMKWRGNLPPVHAAGTERSAGADRRVRRVAQAGPIWR
jgi:hypothetical protein